MSMFRLYELVMLNIIPYILLKFLIRSVVNVHHWVIRKYQARNESGYGVET